MLEGCFQNHRSLDSAEWFEDGSAVANTGQTDRCFSSHGSVGQVFAKSWRKCFNPNVRIFGFRNKLNFWKSHVARENLDKFPLLVGSKSMSKCEFLLQRTWKNCRIKLNHVFPLFKYKCMTRGGSFSLNLWLCWRTQF